MLLLVRVLDVGFMTCLGSRENPHHTQTQKKSRTDHARTDVCCALTMYEPAARHDNFVYQGFCVDLWTPQFGPTLCKKLETFFHHTFVR